MTSNTKQIVLVCIWKILLFDYVSIIGALLNL